MPVLAKKKHDQLLAELRNRYQYLIDVFERRELSHQREGAGTKRWSAPEQMCETSGNDIQISMAVEDFKTILAEIKKLK